MRGGGRVSKRFYKLLAISILCIPLKLFGSSCKDDLPIRSWGTEFPLKFSVEKTSKCITLGDDNSASPVYNKNNLTDSPFSDSMVTISKNPGSKFSEFHNMGNFNITNNNTFIFDMPDVDFYLDGGLFNLQQGNLTLNGRDFYSQGDFAVNGYMTLNFRDFLNVGDTNITGDNLMAINLTGTFNNNANLSLKGTPDKPLSLTIKGGDFYNGKNIAQHQDYFSGNMTLENTYLSIEKNLISEGISDENHSKIQVHKGSNIIIDGNFVNGKYSDIFMNSASLIVKGDFTNSGNFYMKGSNQTNTLAANNITNKAGGEMWLNGVIIYGGGKNNLNFISEPGSKLYFTGTDYGLYGNSTDYADIQANNINIKGALIYFSKGTALANTPYYFLNANTSLEYDPSLLGVKDILSDDGSINEFYEAIVEPVSDSKKSLKITFKPKEVDILDQSEKTIIDIFSKENPIPGFDIKNLSLNQIKTISKNISDGLQSYTHSKDAALSTGFEAIKTNLFARMIGGGNSPSVSHRSAILPYNSSVHYAANTAKSNYPATKASDYTQSDVIAYAPNTNSKDNNLYVNLLGALQTSPGGYGYNYGLSVGYDRNFDDKLFVGVYLAYIGGSLSFDTLSTQTQGFEAGVYARFKTSIFETDMILNQGYAYNKTHKNITILTDTYSTYSHYGTQSYDLLLQSGPRFDFGKNTIKPYIGLNINLNTGGDIDEDAQALASSYHFKDNLYLSESIGIEYKRLFKQGYFFIRPSYEANIWSNASETQVLFLNNTISIAIPPKEMFGSVLLGGEVAINNSLLLNLNASVKASNQKTFIVTGMASLKYVF